MRHFRRNQESLDPTVGASWGLADTLTGASWLLLAPQGLGTAGDPDPRLRQDFGGTTDTHSNYAETAGLSYQGNTKKEGPSPRPGSTLKIKLPRFCRRFLMLYSCFQLVDRQAARSPCLVPLSDAEEAHEHI